MDFAEEFAYKPHAAKKSQSKRGKVSESELEKAFDKMKAECILFDYDRIPDAFSTRGGLRSPRTGDYNLFYRGKTIVVEVKETKNLKALPAGNFSTDSRARLRRRQRAGVTCIVVVFQTVLNVYRVMTLDQFDGRDSGSFQLDNQPALNLQGALQCILLSPSSTTSTSEQTVAPELPLTPS